MIHAHSFLVHTCTYDNLILQGIGSDMFILPPGVTLPKHLIPSTPSASLTHLDDFLYYQSRRCHTVLGDGNCLFRACSHQLYATEDFHAQLRQSLHQSMKHTATISYSQHLQQLKSLGSWGTQLELQAFCDYLCLPLFAHQIFRPEHTAGEGSLHRPTPGHLM